ncbi:heterogeneous nuclear ribonucleoprotein A1-like [Schistocerca piceifrons]|uniref:heterogeneous nuclear ribonucleoprotein A1-like n=1 Tax=Schistocerca piceifrons TaxID=274613 RepID=UPI001F5FBE6F|nr:heterogeneous nuclear ribonucleoprotein A1-like [Schistocerca piceifrons]
MDGVCGKPKSLQERCFQSARSGDYARPLTRQVRNGGNDGHNGDNCDDSDEKGANCDGSGDNRGGGGGGGDGDGDGGDDDNGDNCGGGGRGRRRDWKGEKAVVAPARAEQLAGRLHAPLATDRQSGACFSAPAPARKAAWPQRTRSCSHETCGGVAERSRGGCRRQRTPS